MSYSVPPRATFASRAATPRGTTLHWHRTGPYVRYEGGELHIEDLNPHIQTKWRITRLEMVRFGWRAFIAGLRG